LGALGEAAGEAQRKARTWPDSPRALAGRLRRAATFLRRVGIEISFRREGRARSRTIRISAVPDIVGSPSSATSSWSTTIPTTKGGKDFTAYASESVGNDAGGCSDDNWAAAAVSVRGNRLKSNDVAAADHADANITHVSGPEENDASGSRVR